LSAPRDDEFPVDGVPATDDVVADDAASGDVNPEGLPQGDELTIGQERVLELISYVVVNLVSRPQDVKVDILHRQDRDVYQVRVSPEDLGRVIGKGGQTARALRVLLTAVSARTDQRIGLDIVE
jgi:predicted RNA-binding protein YlqC (UPF0109 family)